MRVSTFTSFFALYTTALAQSSIPASLSSGFDPTDITLAVGLSGPALDTSFADGSTIPLSQASNTPNFALGDASGINTAIVYLVMMLDTTNPNSLILHFLQTGFKADGDETVISTTATPLLSYQKPGTFGETGIRQYSFLLFEQPNSDVTGLPKSGATFDVSTFEAANDLHSALAGLAMTVDLSAAGTGSGATTTGSAAQASTTTVPAAASSATPTSTTAASISTAAASTTAGQPVALSTPSPLIQSTLSTSTSLSSIVTHGSAFPWNNVNATSVPSVSASDPNATSSASATEASGSGTSDGNMERGRGSGVLFALAILVGAAVVGGI